MKILGKILAVGAVLLSATLGLAAAPDNLARVDALFRSPSLDLQQASQGLALYEEQLRAGGATILLLPRLARACFVVGDLSPQQQRAAYYDKGLAYAERLVQEQPGGVAGHYWKALNLCGLADVGSRLQGFRLLPQIMAELEKVLTLDETYDQAGAHRVLGRIYFEAPRISVGDLEKSRRHLAAAVRLAPDNSTNHLYLAETLLRLGDKAQARGELEKVLQAPNHAIRPQGLEEDRREARRLLNEMQ